MAKTQRLSIISVVTKPCFERVAEIKKTLCEYSDSYASLQFPPHITLAHIKYSEGELEQTLKKIERISGKLKGCEIHVSGISCTTYTEKEKTKYQVKFDVEPDPQLIEVHKSLKGINDLDKSNLGGEHYHITLVFGDLTEKNYLRLQSYVTEHPTLGKPFAYPCNDLSVLAREGKKPWRIIRSFKVTQ
jgi:2'-5' RNA ligase